MHRARLLALASGAALALLPLRAGAEAWDAFPALPPKQWSSSSSCSSSSSGGSSFGDSSSGGSSW